MYEEFLSKVSILGKKSFRYLFDECVCMKIDLTLKKILIIVRFVGCSTFYIVLKIIEYERL